MLQQKLCLIPQGLILLILVLLSYVGTSTSIDDDIEENMVIEKDVCVAPEDFSLSMLQKSSALFLLGLKEKHKLTQVAIQEIVENVTSLTQQRLSFLKHQVIVVYLCT